MVVIWFPVQKWLCNVFKYLKSGINTSLDCISVNFKVGIRGIIIRFWFIFSCWSDCENVTLLVVQVLLSKDTKISWSYQVTKTNWGFLQLPLFRIYLNCIFLRCWRPEVRTWHHCAFPWCDRDVCWCSHRVLLPTSCRLGSSQLCSPTWTHTFISGLGETKGDRICLSYTELE